MITRRTIVTSTGSEPVTVAEGRQQLKVGSSSAYDSDISLYLAHARERVEQYTNRYWKRVTIQMEFDRFPPGSRPLFIPVPDLETLTSVTYLDVNQDEQSLTGMTLDVSRQLILYPDGWPVGSHVLVQLSAGPDNDASPPDTIPDGIKGAILMYMADFYENRSAQMPFQLYENKAANVLAHPHRVNMGV